MKTSKRSANKTSKISKKPSHDDFSHNVFINCPFDTRYYPLFHAMVFTIHLLGFRPRCSREQQNAARVRLNKLMNIICECKFGIHDISRTGLNSHNRLPRFNMPFELGIDIGIREVGSANCRSKNLLILDKDPYRYQEFLSDIGGQDIAAHGNKVNRIVSAVRDWLQTETGATDMPSGAIIFNLYKQFRKKLPEICAASDLEMSEMNFLDYSHTAADWVKKNYKRKPH